MPVNSVQDILSKYYSDPRLWGNSSSALNPQDAPKKSYIFFAPQIPPEFLNNVVKHIAKRVNPSAILAAVSSNWLGGSSGKTGIILTADSVYCREPLSDPIMFRFDDLYKTAIKKDQLSVNTYFTINFSADEADSYTLMHDILKEIIKHKKDIISPSAGYQTQVQPPSFSQPVDINALSDFSGKQLAIFVALCCVSPLFIRFPLSLFIIIPLIVLYYIFIDKIAIFQTGARPINLDTSLPLGKVKIYDILRKVMTSLNLSECVLIYALKGTEINCFTLPVKGGFHLFLTTAAIKNCSPRQLQAIMTYSIAFTACRDFKNLLKMFSIYLAPMLIISILYKVIYFPLIIEFRFIPIKSISSFLTKFYKWLISDLKLMDIARGVFILTYACFPLGSIMATLRCRELVKRADIISSGLTGLYDYVYTLYYAYYISTPIPKATPMDVEFTYLKFKFSFFGIFVVPRLKKRLTYLNF
ncbi:MAG: hypothetical protein LBJ61_07380 [Deltaproteobacteria bacterium]|jgi:hypothetical protein|nr:hypothetical protein [Deltaproteobacteria bacterium]